MLINLIVIAILAAAPVALWGALCALNAMDARTAPAPIAGGFLANAIGWGGLIFAAIDYLTGAAPLFWPIALLLSVLMLSFGHAALYLANRRTCSCPDCPSRTRHPIAWR